MKSTFAHSLIAHLNTTYTKRSKPHGIMVSHSLPKIHNAQVEPRPSPVTLSPPAPETKAPHPVRRSRQSPLAIAIPTAHLIPIPIPTASHGLRKLVQLPKTRRIHRIVPQIRHGRAERIPPFLVNPPRAMLDLLPRRTREPVSVRLLARRSHAAFALRQQPA